MKSVSVSRTNTCLKLFDPDFPKFEVTNLSRETNSAATN